MGNGRLFYDQTSLKALLKGDLIKFHQAGIAFFDAFFSTFLGIFAAGVGRIGLVLQVFTMNLHPLEVALRNGLVADHGLGGGTAGKAECNGKGGGGNNRFDVHFNSLL